MLPEFAKSFLRMFRKEAKEEAVVVKNTATDIVINNTDQVVDSAVKAVEVIVDKSVAAATTNTPVAGIVFSATSAINGVIENVAEKAKKNVKKAATKVKGE
jgi:hypothetical protein